MVKTILPQRTTRRERGLQLFRDRGEEIRHIRGSAWSVPSCSGTGVYIVDIRSGACCCPDMPPEDEVCKHATAAIIARAKSGRCVGCGGWFARRELVEVNEDHESLTCFEGDVLCEDCAVGHGVL